MPGMNGDVVIARIKKIFSEYALFKNYLPYICIVSSLAENSDEIQSAVKAGADVFSSKPAGQEFIKRAYNKAIEKQKKN
jgi:CheY-like chemotaxis protein